MSYWIHIYTYLTELLTCHIYKLIFTSFCPSFQLIPVRFLFLLLPIHPKIFCFLLSLLSPLSCLPCLLHYTAFPFPWLFPSLVSFDFKLTNPDEILDHNNLQVFEFFMSLQPACRTTAANFETVALSRQTVLTRIISLEVSYAAGLQSEICLPFFLNASFSFYISFWVFMGFFSVFSCLLGLVSLITNIQNDLEQKDENILIPGSAESTKTDFSWRKIPSDRQWNNRKMHYLCNSHL